MDEQSLQLYNHLAEYREHLNDAEAPEHIQSAVDSVLSALNGDEQADEDELDLIAAYIEESDSDNQESESLLDLIREYEERAA